MGRSYRAYEGMPAYNAGYNDCKKDTIKLLVGIQEQLSDILQDIVDEYKNENSVLVKSTGAYRNILTHVHNLNGVIRVINTEIKDKTK